MRNYNTKNQFLCERDLGSLPAGREDLEAAGEHLAQYLGGL